MQPIAARCLAGSLAAVPHAVLPFGKQVLTPKITLARLTECELAKKGLSSHAKFPKLYEIGFTMVTALASVHPVLLLLLLLLLLSLLLCVGSDTFLYHPVWQCRDHLRQGRCGL